ncbi:MAG: hypothetical protein J0L53_12295 [Spirochaetes bacterium]|nr:hypothetical protein [Spirochaetota bacterium]
MYLLQRLIRNLKLFLARRHLALVASVFISLMAGCNNYALLDKIENPGGSSNTEKFTDNLYIFVSSWSTLGAMGGSPYNSECGGSTGDAKADCTCTRAALSRGLRRNSTHVFRAWLSTSTTNAICRIQGLANGCSTSFSVPWFNTKGEVVQNNFSGFTAGTTINAVRYDEFGVDQGGTQVWTGTSATGSTITSMTCSDWTDQTGTFNGQYGDRTSNAAAWTTSTSIACNNNYRIYCVASPN